MDKKIAVGVVIIVGIALRLVNLDQSFWLDEASQAQLSSLPISQIWNGRNGDFQPPLFYILSHIWLMGGTSEIWLRLLPVAFGILAIPALYALVKKIFQEEKLALASAFLLAINPFHIYYSQEFRMYSLVMLLGILSWILLLSRNKLWFLVTAALLYTHYSTVLLVVAQIVYIAKFRRELISWFGSQLILTGVLFIPWLPHFVVQLQGGVRADEYLPGWGSLLSLPTARAIPEIIFKLVAGRINLLPRWVYYIYIGFVFTVVAGCLTLARKQRGLLWIWLVVPLVFGLLISFVTPLMQPFRLIFILPSLIIIMAQAVIKYPRLGLAICVYIALVGNLLYFTRPRLQREQWRQALNFLNSQSGTILMEFPDRFAPLAWYPVHIPSYGVVPSFPAQGDQVNQVLDNLPATSDYWLITYLADLTDPNHLVSRNLEERSFQIVQSRSFEGVGTIHHYHKE